MKSQRYNALALAMAGAALLTLSACGGGDSNTATNTTPPAASNPDQPVSKSTLSGTAATGSALANANVSVTDANGVSPCEEASITTSALGTYTCTLKTGATAPFFIVVTDPSGNTAPLVSVATSAPAAGAALTVNATPLTTAIVAQLAADGNALSVVNSKTVDAAKLQQVTANVLTQLGNVLSAIGAPANYNPFSTAISAATVSNTGNTADQVLDVVKVVTDPSTGKLALSTIDNPTPVVLATADNAGGQLAAPAAGVADLPAANQQLAKALTACFALTKPQRVLDGAYLPASQGGNNVTSMGTACQNIGASSSNGAGIEFLHNGYAYGQFMVDLLISDTMTGAQFSVPEVMLFTKAANSASGRDEAVLNIKYLDANGNPGNKIVSASNVPNSASAAHASTWWLTGNGQPVDVSVRTLVRRVEQMNPSFSNPNSNNYSHFQSGIQFSVNAKGPGSVNGNDTLTRARIKGPGLPVAGLVYTAPVDAEVGQNYMDVTNQTGDVTSDTGRCGLPANAPNPTYNCPNYWVGRTAGITAATGAGTFRNNQGGVSWANGSLQSGAIARGAKYQIELFYGSNTTATYTYRKTLLTDLIPATQAVNLPWNTLGSRSLALLDPNGSLAGVQQSPTMDWVQNIAAEQIGGIAISVDPVGTYSTTTTVAKGATSAAVIAQAAAFNANSIRSLLLNYRMLDNSSKSAAYTFN
ncbi:hypothetical protein LMG31506_03679 [Cupriavidus yeoncheonensis]|uniref:Uncharacterized protein n=1 Tax=Cupriavidus yeoncheonensis TaxID=1462994 RepID=A0A916N5D9_9BURK|nr:hypothetical protein [Cupriavidus yeoncheonensis]CAG2147796.1 hypothetical protein LMG31506_03679 [Cupriavidus yeoncheonensis]